MTRTQQQFLELLRSGLWGTPADPSLFQQESTDWKSILKTAKEQTVLVIVADGIETLPKELWPSKETMLKLMMTRVKTAQMHHLLNSTLNQIVNVLDKKGIPSVLLKGQGVAQNYRNPESRTCGDIDLYVGTHNYNTACEIIAAMNKDGEYAAECDHHMHLQVNGVEIEVHRKAGFMQNRKDDTSFQQWCMDSIDNLYGTDKLGSWDNHGTEIMLAAPTFDAFFILYHALRHMTTEGVGFRQICDWAMYLHKHHAEIDIEQLTRRLKEFNMESVWKEFEVFATTLLGMPVDSLIFTPKPMYSRKTEKLLNQIFISGNFGRFDYASMKEKRSILGSKQNPIIRKMRSFRFQTLRLLNLYILFPKYSIHYWWDWTIRAIQRFSHQER